MFAPLEDLPFAVDACFAARWIPNDQAVALTRRKLIDSDHAYTEETYGDHGPTADTAARPELARELEEYLTASDRPPLLRAQIGLAIGAASRDELERRVERVRREFAPIRLHRPLGEQFRLFVSHLPAQLPTVPGYDDVLLLEQFGATVPIATHAVGASAGLYIGHTLSAAGHPVLFDLTEGSRTSRPPAVLCAGTLGSGKTITAQLLALQAFLAGSRVVDIDPKGDHRLADAVGHEHVEHVELRPGDDHRGVLDPLRIAPPDTRAELAYSFLTELLPAPVPAPWQTEIRAAVEQAATVDGSTCGDVLEVLEAGAEEAQSAARAIGVHAGTGLLRLGFADRGSPAPPAGERAITSLRIANLTLPLPGTPRSELTAEERTGRALLRLLATYALHLMGSDWTRRKVLLFDEAWMLLEDAAGLALVQRINRLCRSQNATPILVTQLLADVASLAELAGAVFAFGVETDAEAGRALELLGLDDDDARMRAQLRAFRRGRCFLRDYEGRVGAMQVGVADEHLLATLDTTPTRDDSGEAVNGNRPRV
jgi:AAA-like domain